MDLLGGERWGFEGWGAPRVGGGPEGWGAQNFAHFSLSCRENHSFLPSLGVFSWNFSGVLVSRPQMCLFSPSVSCETPADKASDAPHEGPLKPEDIKPCLCEGVAGLRPAGVIDFGQFRLRPALFFEFGQFDFGQFRLRPIFDVEFWGDKVWGLEGWAPKGATKPRKSGARRVGPEGWRTEGWRPQGWEAQRVEAPNLEKGPRKVGPRRVEPRRVEPRRVEPGRVEPPRVEPRKVEPPRVEPRRVGGPKFRAFFSLLPATIFLSSFSLGVLSWNVGGV